MLTFLACLKNNREASEVKKKKIPEKKKKNSD